MNVALQTHTPIQFELVPDDFAERFMDHILKVYTEVSSIVQWSEEAREAYIPGIPVLDHIFRPSNWFYLVGVMYQEACDPLDFEGLLNLDQQQMFSSAKYQEMLREHSGEPFHHLRSTFVFDVMRALNYMGLSYKEFHRPKGREWDPTANYRRQTFTIHNCAVLEVW